MDCKSLVDRLPWARGVAVLASDENGLIAIDKPTGVLSHPNRAGDRERAVLAGSYDQAERAFRARQTDTGDEVQVFLLNRLDSATSGVLLLALDREVARAALRSFELRQVRKRYQALVFGAPRGGGPLWRDRLSVKREQGGVRARSGGGLLAETKLLKVEPMPGAPLVSRLTLEPVTGRTHQLRLQTSLRGAPIVGDKTYGDFSRNKQIAKSRAIKRLCLHCVGTELDYRFRGRLCHFEAHSAAPF